MEKTEYQNVNTNSSRNRDSVFLWKPFLKQLFICAAVSCNHFSFGLAFGAPTVLIPQMRQEANSTAVISDDMASWISSSAKMSSMAWMIILSVSTSVFGRKISFITVAAVSLIGFIVFYCSDTPLQVIIAEVILGVGYGATCSVSPMVLTEYSSPEHRGVFLTMNCASYFWGVWFANTIGTFSHWRNIGILGMLCSIFNMTSIYWPESPDWLAKQGRFDNCAEAHRWLKGNSVRSENELNSVMAYYEQAINNKVEKSNFLLRKTLTVMKDQEFYKPIYLIFLLLLLLFFSGKCICTMYSLVILKKITNSSSAAYTAMLILDGLTVVSAYVGCAVTKILKRRPFFLASSSICIVFMLLISLQLYLIKLDIISSNHVISILLLSGYTITVSCGPVILSLAIIFEIVPSKFKTFIYVTFGLFTCLFLSAFLKLSLWIFEILDMHGTFLLYALPSLLFLFLLYKGLPETKDKTIQEIEKFFRPE